MEVNFWKGHLRIGHQQIGWSRGLSILGTAQGFKTMLHRKRTDFKTLIEFWDNQISVYVRRYLFVAQPWRAYPASNGFVFFFSFSKRPIWPSFKSCFCFSQKLPWAWFGPLDSTGSSWVLDVSGATIIWPSGLNLTSGSKATRIYLFLTGELWKVCEVDHMQLGFGTWLGGLGNHWQGWKNCGRQTIWHWRLANGLVFDLYESVLSFEVHSLYFHVSRQLAQRQCSKHWRLGYPKFVSSQL